MISDILGFSIGPRFATSSYSAISANLRNCSKTALKLLFRWFQNYSKTTLKLLISFWSHFVSHQTLVAFCFWWSGGRGSTCVENCDDPWRPGGADARGRERLYYFALGDGRGGGGGRLSEVCARGLAEFESPRWCHLPWISADTPTP